MSGPEAMAALNRSGFLSTDFSAANPPDDEPMNAQPSRDLNVRKFARTKSGTSSVSQVPIRGWSGISLPS